MLPEPSQFEPIPVDWVSARPILEPANAVVSVRAYSATPWCVVEVAGEFDLVSLPKLRGIGDGAAYLIFDLSRVTFMDAAGLGVIARSLRAAREFGGAVRLVGPSGQIRKLLTLTGLDRELTMHDSLVDALATDAVAEPGTLS